MEEKYQQNWPRLWPGRKRIWTEKRRNIVHKVFRRELLNFNLSITQSKVQKALDEINRLEQDAMDTINFDKLRGYIYKARKTRQEKIKNDVIPSPLPSDSDSDAVCDDEKDAEHKPDCFLHENDTESEKSNLNLKYKLKTRFLKDEVLNKTVKLLVIRKKHDDLSKFDEGEWASFLKNEETSHPRYFRRFKKQSQLGLVHWKKLMLLDIA